MRRRETQGLKKVESSTLKESEEEKTRGVLHSKCRSKRRKISSFLFFCILFLCVCFFPFFCLRRRRCHRLLLHVFVSYLPSPPPTYLPFLSFFVLLLQWRRRKQLVAIAFFFGGVTTKKAITTYCHCFLLCVWKEEDDDGNAWSSSMVVL